MKYTDTQFIRAIGILLIINSHLDKYYPIKAFATGGAIGNSIFFFLSSFGVYLSLQQNSRTFKTWFTERIVRIYPSAWIVIVFLLLPWRIIARNFTSNDALMFMGNFFYPPYWFIQALLVYYILSFNFLQRSQKSKLICLFSILGCLYFIYYLTWVDLTKWSIESGLFCRIHYFMIFLFGIFIAQKNSEILYTGVHNYFIFLFFIFIVYTHKFLMTKDLYAEFQLVQQAAMYPILYFGLKISRSPIVSNSMQYKTVSATIAFLSNHTLEIYMVHETITFPIVSLKMGFPWNVLFFIVLTFIFSAIIKTLADAMRQKMR